MGMKDRPERHKRGGSIDRALDAAQYGSENARCLFFLRNGLLCEKCQLADDVVFLILLQFGSIKYGLGELLQ